MKINHILPLVNINNTFNDIRVQSMLEILQLRITQMEHPLGSKLFHLNPIRQGNGVKTIKDTLMKSLTSDGWVLEHRLDLSVTQRKPGPIDAVLPLNDGSSKYIAIEWETGNISSSHRAVNKLVSGLLTEKILCGVLILPSSEMYRYLTDRVGNFDELQPYFQVWSKANYPVEEGCIVVIEVEHDLLSTDVPLLAKGTDGRALK
ncbi:hypothetical protein [Proteiniclasticum ruminis]|uniref:Restriction endonuclease BamHI n=1 Tax=Proteiniclasticum ruminis TaxID=398199 RepID=A0A1G8RUA9_9CLOT|nr:hypothetical protein [Proteiniclasticum ruminis]SDJ19920.1 Restriction endonuclease BamHI [Proteiniclasticum ruminis]